MWPDGHSRVKRFSNENFRSPQLGSTRRESGGQPLEGAASRLTSASARAGPSWSPPAWRLPEPAVERRTLRSLRILIITLCHSFSVGAEPSRSYNVDCHFVPRTIAHTHTQTHYILHCISTACIHFRDVHTWALTFSPQALTSVCSETLRWGIFASEAWVTRARTHTHHLSHIQSRHRPDLATEVQRLHRRNLELEDRLRSLRNRGGPIPAR